MKKALLIYYTFTGEAGRVVERATAELRSGGYEVESARVDFADAELRLRRPLSPAAIKRWTKAAAAGTRFPVAVEPTTALRQTYDLICLVSNTWQHHPCVPIRSLLASPNMQATLKGKPFGVFVVCRRSFKKNLEIVRREAEQCGGHFVGGEHFRHSGSDIGSLIRTVSYLMSSGDKVARLFGFRLPLPRYGLSDSAIQRVAEFTRLISMRVNEEGNFHVEAK